MLDAATGPRGRAFAKEFAGYQAARQLVDALAVTRAVAGLSQEELAAKIGCGQPKVSKLEHGTDADVRFGDAVDCLRATGHKLRAFIIPEQYTLADEVAMHAAAIQALLERMSAPAGADPAGDLVRVETLARAEPPAGPGQARRANGRPPRERRPTNSKV